MMNAQLVRANLERLQETDPLLPVAQWVSEGERGKVMCLDCKIKAGGRDQLGHCDGCPRAWREVFGEVEFWDEPHKRDPIHNNGD